LAKSKAIVVGMGRSDLPRQRCDDQRDEGVKAGTVMASLLRTDGRKPRLPTFLSYPIGAEALSDGLRGIPQFEELTLRFWDNPVNRASTFRRLVETDAPHMVLRAMFERVGKLLHGQWKVDVYPVRRDRKSHARVALVKDALPRIVSWFSEERPPSWYWGRKCCNVVFIPAEGTVRFEDIIEGV
jgi:hypothetical protein